MFGKYLILLSRVSVVKTFFFNFKYFTFRTAVKMPVFVDRYTFLRCCQGKVYLPDKIYPGMIRIGVRGLGSEDYKRRRVVWFNKGSVIFGGSAFLGSGSRISVGEGAKLAVGDNFVITGASTIIAEKEITIKKNCLLSWDILLMDTDFHDILIDGKKTNYPKRINIGNHVWIGCNTTILKGVVVPDNVVIASHSTITHSIAESNVIVGGDRNNIIYKRNVNWSD